VDGARAFRGVGGALAFAGGLLAACAVLSAAVDPTLVGGGRIDWVRAHPEAYDTLFVGSSRTGRQVMPSVFDAAMAEAGRPTRSFNLGLPGMRPPEDAYVVERALEGRRAPLRLLVVESNPVRIGLAPEDRETARAVYWHDARRMRTLWRRAFSPSSVAPDVPPSEVVVRQHARELADHARHWLWNATRVGRGAALLQEAIGLPRAPRGGGGLGPARDGFQPRPQGETFTGERLEEYRRRLAEALETPHRLRYGDAESQAELLRKRALAERHGARLVLVAPPYLHEPFAPLPSHGIPFLDFSDPRRFPDLFADALRIDAGHLNPRGAELYSRLLARELLAAVGGEAAP
jgi:hypothetical protein